MDAGTRSSPPGPPCRGGPGAVHDADRERLRALGVRAVFGPESPLDEVVRQVAEIARGAPLAGEVTEEGVPT